MTGRLQIWQWLRFTNEAIVPDPLPTCPADKKVCYPSKRQATAARDWLADHENDRGLIVYRCLLHARPDQAGVWHFGHAWWAKREARRKVAA